MKPNGFSLIEVLLALMVVSMGAAALSQGIGTGAARLERGWRLTAAHRFARSTAERIGFDMPLRAGTLETGNLTFLARLDKVDIAAGTPAWYVLSVASRDRPSEALVTLPVVPSADGVGR